MSDIESGLNVNAISDVKDSVSAIIDGRSVAHVNKSDTAWNGCKGFNDTRFSTLDNKTVSVDVPDGGNIIGD